MNRADRRKQQREEARQNKALSKKAQKQLMHDIEVTGTFDAQKALNTPFYMAHMTKMEIERRAAMAKNGITQEDLKEEYEKGYAAARKDLLDYVIKMYNGAACIALHEIYRFGERRLYPFLRRTHEVMVEELSSGEMLERCLKETKMDIESLWE